MPQESRTQADAADVGDAAERPAAGPPAAGNTRRGLLIGAGLAGVAGLAAACGGSDDSSGDGGKGGDAGAQSPAGGTGTGGAGVGGGKELAAASEIPVGGGKVFEAEKVVVCQPAQGEFKAFSATCPHRGCSVGSVSGGTINCPCHGSKFKITDGSVANPPAKEPLKEKKVTVEGGKIMLA
ncbi:Rieske (2Fe-2S) protein [Actinomadura rubrisoli]|uniref:Cytochrome bc1 complex Rieske iron-sulfur subunit n=1 Tax=Actinomadura rubrisoli TaxID=2530368 RepID=A0A4V2YQV5_9ACTN|nr:Rieske (2Fe-2S) protein [Actinomadura rubrisoli]TDD63617.1 Rieske (2Fe-2S) protein [Actinomadura rubrisoli]